MKTIMDNWNTILNSFILQAKEGDLKTSSYPKEYSDLKMKVSFGMGVSARIPWIAFTAPEMQVSKGFYPVYLYYKEEGTLILAYGISETEEYESSWPVEIMDSEQTIKSYFGKNVPRYGDSYICKSYSVNIENNDVIFLNPIDKNVVPPSNIESDLNEMLNRYKKIVSMEVKKEDSPLGHGLFYMEKQLEDFIVHNWDNTALGKKYDLIIEEGELVSQQYRTDIGSIDILAKDKKNGSYVVIELKKNQTSDDTVGQVTRYMGWIKEKKNDNNVKGIIVAGAFDKKLEYALKMVSNVEVFLYELNFKLTGFSK